MCRVLDQFVDNMAYIQIILFSVHFEHRKVLVFYVSHTLHLPTISIFSNKCTSATFPRYFSDICS